MGKSSRHRQAHSFSVLIKPRSLALGESTQPITLEPFQFQCGLERVVQTNLEQKVVTYRDFQPVRDLVMSACPTARLIRIKSCFGEAAGLSGLASDTTVLKAEQTLINWQSCSDAGRDHKKKELCGRAVALRYSWDAKPREFTPRPGVKKLILVVDGTWRQPDLDALIRAGWDEIFYPDEMEKLVDAIV